MDVAAQQRRHPGGDPARRDHVLPRAELVVLDAHPRALHGLMQAEQADRGRRPQGGAGLQQAREVLARHATIVRPAGERHE